MNIIPRSEWQDPKHPITGPAMSFKEVTLLPAHYTADAVIPDNIPFYLRSMQRSYLNSRGYSLGYSFAIDQTGQAYEIRGFDIKCAANLNYNDKTIAILCMVNGSQPMNSAMVETFKALGAEAQRRVGRKLNVVGHRDIGATQCPGDGIYAQVRAGHLTPGDAPGPTPPKPPTPTGDTMATAILQVPGRNAQFIGTGTLMPDGSVHCVFIAWFGPGPDPVNGIEGAFVTDHSAASDIVYQETLPTTLQRDNIFLGDVDEIEDSAYNWGYEDFYRVVP